MMRSSLKKIGASALALTLASGSYGALDFARRVSAAPRGMANVAFAPAFRSDAAVVMGACLDKERAWGIVDAFIEKFGAMSGVQGAEISELKSHLAAYKANPFKDAPPTVQKLVNESGLYDADIRWAVMSFEEMPDFSAGSTIPNGLSIAIAGNVDVRRFLRAFESNLKEKPQDAAEFKELTVEGEMAWQLVPLNERSAKAMKESNVDFHVAWLDRQLAIAALSPAALARQIRLYRTGEMKGDALRGFSSAGTVAGVFVSGIGELIRQSVPPENLEAVTAVIPNGKQILCGLKTIVIELKSVSGSDLHLSLRVCTASEADADMLRTMVKTVLMAGRAQLAQSPELAAELQKVLDGVKVGGVDGILEVTLDTTVSDLTDALAKVIEQIQRPKVSAPRGEGSSRRRRRTSAATEDNL